MPWYVIQTKACPADKPWGVLKKDTGELVEGGCHANKVDANQHMRALYANVKEAENK